METIDKKSLSERDICTKFITPALDRAGWDLLTQVREEVYFTKGRVIVKGNLRSRGEGKRADYVLYFKPNLPLAVIEATVEAIEKGQNRILLVMATGTGKTYTAFQIIWRLWKAGVKKRILYLADRNILVNQARINDFKPFGSAMTKITHRQVDKSYEIYLALYQAVRELEEQLYSVA